MKENFKIEKELLFKHNIKDITSISLDREYKVDGNEIKGNFLINGEYKVHELSLNREKFNFKIPFKYELKDDIERDSIEIEISNFIYDYSKDELLVTIEYDVVGDRKDVLIFEDEESLDDFLKNREVDVVDTRVEEIKENIEDEDVEIIPSSSDKCDLEDKVKEEINIEEKTIEDERNIKEIFEQVLPIKQSKEDNIIEEKNIEIKSEKEENVETEDIVNNVSIKDNNFITYKIYKLNEMDTLEGLVIKFHTSIDELKEYNDLSNISAGSKLIIPYYE